MTPGGGEALPVRVGLVDSSQLVIETLHALLEARPDVRVVATARSVGGARQLLDMWSVDVLVMAALLPDGDPLTLWPRLRVTHPSPRLVILGTHATAEWRLPASARRGRRVVVLPHDSSWGHLVQELLQPAESSTPLRVVGRPASADVGPSLTPAEHRVLALLLAGATSSAVAVDLGVSQDEANRYVRAAVAKQLTASGHGAVPLH